MPAFTTVIPLRPLSAALSMVLAASLWVPTLAAPASATERPAFDAAEPATGLVVEITGIAAPVLM